MLWSLGSVSTLSTEARRHIRDGANEVFVSVVSPWEAAIKHASGKLEMTGDLEAEIAAASLRILPITVQHALAAAALPAHHRDPFDRMLIAQASIEGLTVVTRDPRFEPYGVSILRA